MILVTGSTGIVGTRLVFDLLKKGEKVRALHRASSDLEFVRSVFDFYDPANGPAMFRDITWVKGNVLDLASVEEAMSGVKQVYHTAALVSYSPADSDKLLAVNGEGTENVVNAALAYGVEKLCHISSVSALGTELNGPIKETTHWKRSNNRSTYGLSKHIAEREVWRARAEGLPVVVVNPSVILGPAKADQSSGMLFHMLTKGVPYYPTGMLGLVDVRDVARISIALMHNGVSGVKFILNSENITYRELLTHAAEVYGNPVPKFRITGAMLEPVWRAAALAGFLTNQKPKITKETARNASRKVSYDNSKVREMIGTDFISVKASLEYYRDFFRSRR